MAHAFSQAKLSPLWPPEAVARLLSLAPLFDVSLAIGHEGRATVRVREGAGFRDHSLPAARAHLRVLTEVCEKVVPWVYFHEGEHCAHSLLRHSDERILRLAELYREKVLETGGAFDGYVTTLPSECMSGPRVRRRTAPPAHG